MIERLAEESYKKVMNHLNSCLLINRVQLDDLKADGKHETAAKVQVAIDNSIKLRDLIKDILAWNSLVEDVDQRAVIVALIAHPTEPYYQVNLTDATGGGMLYSGTGRDLPEALSRANLTFKGVRGYA